MDNKTFQENAVKLRKQRKLTQQEVADQLGISRIAYSKLERGETRLFNESAEKLAQLFDVPADELFFGGGDRLGERSLPYGTGAMAVAENASALAARERELALQADVIRAQQETIDYQRQLIRLLQEKLEGR